MDKELKDKIEILDILKQIYDSVFIKKLFKGENNASISNLMVKYYNQHKEDLKFLKDIFRNNRNLYNKLFFKTCTRQIDDKRTIIYRHKGKTTVLEEIIKAVIILKTTFIIVLFFMLLCFGLFIL